MAVTRRDFVAMLLGTPAAMAACRGGGRARTPDGELLTPGKAAGHRLRDAVEVAEDLRDAATADMLTNRLQVHEKAVWMLRATVAS